MLAMFGCNTYSYMLSHSAKVRLTRLAYAGSRELELMAHPGHLWSAELTAEKRRILCNLLDARGPVVTTLDPPNMDINIAGTMLEMRSYPLERLCETVELAGALGARGVVLSPGNANPLLPATLDVLQGCFFAALDRLCPLVAASGSELWLESIPFSFSPSSGGLIELLKSRGNEALRIVYDIASVYFVGEHFTAGATACGSRLALVQLSDTGRAVYRHDPVGACTLFFAVGLSALTAVGYGARPMPEIISRDPDRDIAGRRRIGWWRSDSRLHISSIKEVHQGS